MVTSARVVVVGGGVVGTSVLYHLAERGWTDAVLCEKDQLTSGSTWHAAGHVIAYGLNPANCRLNEYSCRLYADLERRTGQPSGFHQVGNLRLATAPGRLDEYRRFIGLAETLGIQAELLDADGVKGVWPLVDTTGLLGGLLTPEDGHADPTALTMALAAGARQLGATILQGTEVTGFSERPGGWRVHTSGGEIDCEHVVSCSGNQSQQVLGMVGLPSHVISIRHQFLVSGPIPAFAEHRRLGLPEMPVMRDPEQLFYVRPEVDGVVLGFFGGRGESVFMNGVPRNFVRALLGPDMEALLPYAVAAAERVPALEDLEIRSIVNGPMPYSPDDLPMVGPVPGRRNFWQAEGTPNGITLAGGIGWQLATWITEGEPSIDLGALDPRRFGSHATRTWSARKTEEANERTYQVPLPDEEMAAGRPLKTTPIHDILAARGAVFGEVHGWERPNWFAPAGTEPVERYGFREQSWGDHVARECAAIRGGLSAADVSHGARIEVAGPGARPLLELLVRPAVPDAGHAANAWIPTGRETVALMIGIQADADDRFVVSSAAGSERLCRDLIDRAAGGRSDVRLADLTGREGCLLLSGPAAPAILRGLSRSDIRDLDPVEFDERRFPVGALRHVLVNFAPVLAVRTDAFGQPAWELHTASEFLRHVFLEVAAAADGLMLVGARSLEAMRLELRAPAWGREIDGDTMLATDGCARRGDEPWPVGLHRAGKPAGPVRRRLASVRLDAAPPFPLSSSQPIREPSGRLVGVATSAGVDTSSGLGVALGYLDPDVEPGDAVTLTALGQRLPAVVERWLPNPYAAPSKP